MGLYGGTKVTYNPPPPDNTFSKYLEYQQAREKTLDDRAEQEKQRPKLKKLHVKHLEQQDMLD
jgi:hypothetical protein